MRKLQSKRNLKQLNLSQASEALSPWPGLLCPFSASLNLRDSFILELDFYLQDSSVKGTTYRGRNAFPYNPFYCSLAYFRTNTTTVSKRSKRFANFERADTI